MNRTEDFFKPDDEDRNQDSQKSVCPVCLLSPCSETCPVGFTQKEIDYYRDLLSDRTKN